MMQMILRLQSDNRDGIISSTQIMNIIKDKLFVGFVQNGEGRGDGGVTVQNAPFVYYKKGKYAIFLFAAKKLMVHIVVS